MTKITSEHFKSSTLIDDAEWQVIEQEEGLILPENKTTDHLPLCDRPWFESTVGLFIMLNAFFMAAQLDHFKTSTTKWPWMMVDAMFCCVFATEIAIRIHCLGFCNYVRQKKYLFDTLLVSLNITDSAIQLAGSDSTGLQAFSALRILRVFKIVKMLRIVRMIEDLHLIVIGLISAVKSLQWVALMLGLVVFIVSIVLKILVGNECDNPEFQASFIYHFGLASDIEATAKCFEFWGTIPRSMYTLYQVTTLESWSQVIARPIWDVRPSYVFVILAFQFLTTFGLMNIVVAAVVDGTMNSSDEFIVEKKVMKTTVSHLQIVRSIFEQSVGTDGNVTADKFVPLLAQGAVRRKLLTMDISYDDPSQIFRILDAKGTGRITLTELTQGFMRMRGNAKSKDLLAVRALVYRCHQEIVKEMKEIKELESTVDLLFKDMNENFRQMLAEERRMQNSKQDQILANGNCMDIGKPLQQAQYQTLAKGLPMDIGKPLQQSDSQICEQITKISSRIDCLLSSCSPAPPSPPSTYLQCNLSVPKSTDMPVSVTNAMGEFVQLEHSKQLQQLQQEFQTLTRWLELVPKGLQAKGASTQMQNCFQGDIWRPIGLEPGFAAEVFTASIACAAPQLGLRGVGNEVPEQRPALARLPPNAKK